jgi:hypothetical protein
VCVCVCVCVCVFCVCIPVTVARSASPPTLTHSRRTQRQHEQAKLFKFALYGEGMKACGTFPVHFAKDEHGVFQVDKELQVHSRAAAAAAPCKQHAQPSNEQRGAR